MSAPSAGALRVAERIGMLAGFRPIIVNALAEVIDTETASKELAEALRGCLLSCKDRDPSAYEDAKRALAKYEARQ